MDTSVWVSFFRGTDRAAADRLDMLLDENAVGLAIPVKIELLSGASGGDRMKLQRVLTRLPHFLPTPLTWSKMEGWTALAVHSGNRFGVGDLLVAAIAHDQEGAVWSLDADFRGMARLGFVTLYEGGR